MEGNSGVELRGGMAGSSSCGRARRWPPGRRTASGCDVQVVDVWRSRVGRYRGTRPRAGGVFVAPGGYLEVGRELVAKPGSQPTSEVRAPLREGEGGAFCVVRGCLCIRPIAAEILAKTPCVKHVQPPPTRHRPVTCSADPSSASASALLSSGLPRAGRQEGADVVIYSSDDVLWWSRQKFLGNGPTAPPGPPAAAVDVQPGVRLGTADARCATMLPRRRQSAADYATRGTPGGWFGQVCGARLPSSASCSALRWQENSGCFTARCTRGRSSHASAGPCRRPACPAASFRPLSTSDETSHAGGTSCLLRRGQGRS